MFIHLHQCCIVHNEGGEIASGGCGSNQICAIAFE